MKIDFDFDFVCRVVGRLFLENQYMQERCERCGEWVPDPDDCGDDIDLFDVDKAD